MQVCVQVKGHDKKVASTVRAVDVILLEGDDLSGRKEPGKVPKQLIPR